MLWFDLARVNTKLRDGGGGYRIVNDKYRLTQDGLMFAFASTQRGTGRTPPDPYLTRVESRDFGQ